MLTVGQATRIGEKSSDIFDENGTPYYEPKTEEGVVDYSICRRCYEERGAPMVE